MELIDTHCHLDVAEFAHDRAEILQRCQQRGIRRIVIPAVDFAGWNNLLALCTAQQGLYAALGLHPIYIEQHQPAHLVELEKILSTTRVVAVGEIGLDFFVKELDRDKQQTFFESQLQIAKQFQLPVILHVRKAHDQVLKTLRQIRPVGGIAHAFNGSLQQAQQYLDLGFKLGFGGTMTYSNARKIHELAKSLPLEAIVLETDAPDMVVEAHRGERNSPEYLTDCLAALAKLRNLSEAEVAAQTSLNARAVLPLMNNHA